MVKTLKSIAFDADDTLWHNERFFRVTQERFAELLMDFTPQDIGPEQLDRLLLDAESRNLGRYGYGVKGFTLSMIETAIEVTDARVPAHVIRELLEAGQMMLSFPIEILPHAETAVKTLASDYHLVLITKGDLLDQERKLAQSGLGEFFDSVEIVSDKTPQVYTDIFRRHDLRPEQVMMVGNSMRSDILPVLEAGGWATFVPHGLVWDHEHADPPEQHDRFFEIPDLGTLPDLIAKL